LFCSGGYLGLPIKKKIEIAKSNDYFSAQIGQSNFLLYEKQIFYET
jgi:hypothetical protein